MPRRSGGNSFANADSDHAQTAEPVSDRAGKRLAQSPQQVLQGKREAEDVAAPCEFSAHRLNEKAESRSRTEAQQGDGAAAGDDHKGRPPSGKIGSRREAAC